jgi:integrase
MAMPTVKLNAKTINAIVPPTAGEVFYFDDALTGFGYRVRVGAHGKLLRSWICQYKRAGGTRRLTIDTSGALTADQARARAREILAEVALGRDPQADKADRRDRDQNTLRSVVKDYLAAKKVRKRTLHDITGYLTDPRHFGDLHGMPVDQIKRRDIATSLMRIKKRGPAMAGNARAALSAFFAWAMGEGLVESNPVIGTNKPETNGARERVLTDDELARVWKACNGDDHGRIVRFLILTGCRRQEVGDMCWSWFSPDMSSFTIPADRSKNHKAHTLPVMPMLRAIVDTVPHMEDRDQLFGSRASGFSRWHLKPELDQRCGVTNWTLHDLRRTFSTRLNELGAPPWIVEAILNHSRRGVEAVYNLAAYRNQMREALAMWEDHVRALVGGGKRKVVSLHQKTA